MSKKKQSWEPKDIVVYGILFLILFIGAVLAFIEVPYQAEEVTVEVVEHVTEEPFTEVILEPFEEDSLESEYFTELEEVPIYETRNVEVCEDVPYNHTIEVIGDISVKKYDHQTKTGYYNDRYYQKIRICSFEDPVIDIEQAVTKIIRTIDYTMEITVEICNYFEDELLECTTKVTESVYYDGCSDIDMIWHTEFDERKNMQYEVLEIDSNYVCAPQKQTVQVGTETQEIRKVRRVIVTETNEKAIEVSGLRNVTTYEDIEVVQEVTEHRTLAEELWIRIFG